MSTEIRLCEASMSNEALADLMARCAADAEGVTSPSVEAVEKMQAGRVMIAVAQGEPVGVCAMGLPEGEETAVLRFLGVRPERRRQGIGRILILQAVADAEAQGYAVLRMGTSIDSRNAAGVGLLTQAGWLPVRGAGLRMWRELTELPEAVPAEGYEVRSFEPGDEAAFVRVKNAAFSDQVNGGRAWTVEDFQKEYFESSYFRPERVLFAVYEGEPVGTTTAWTAEYEGREVGLIHWVAVVPEHRKKGLGWVLNVLALHKMKEMGYREAVLNTNETLESAVRLYHRLGFQEVYRRVVFEKKLSRRVEPDEGITAL